MMYAGHRHAFFDRDETCGQYLGLKTLVFVVSLCEVAQSAMWMQILVSGDSWSNKIDTYFNAATTLCGKTDLLGIDMHLQLVDIRRYVAAAHLCRQHRLWHTEKGRCERLDPLLLFKDTTSLQSFPRRGNLDADSAGVEVG